MIKKLAVKVGFIFAMTALISSVGLLPAQAASGSRPTSATVSRYIPECVAAYAEATKVKMATPAECLVTQGISVGAVTNVTATEVKADSSLSEVQKADLLVQVAAAGVTKRNWSQFTTGGIYTVTHNGAFYFNGTRVWVTATYLGYQGSHSCFTNYAAGVVITHNSCSESGNTTSRNLYDQWTVSALVAGGPAAYGVSMTATVSKTGTITGFGATVG